MSANASGIDLDKLGMSAVPETSGEEARLAKGCVRRHVRSGDQRHGGVDGHQPDRLVSRMRTASSVSRPHTGTTAKNASSSTTIPPGRRSPRV